MSTDFGLENLLELNGEIIAFDNGMWAKFVAIRVEPDEARPHGISYSLTLHGRGGERIFGIDNAHPVRVSRSPTSKKDRSSDHIHRGTNTRPYNFVDAGTLLEDFWTEVENTQEVELIDSRLNVLKVGIASAEFVKARTIAIARGQRSRDADEPQVWFTSINSLAQVLSEPNRLLLELIRKAKPASLTELAELTGRRTSNLSRTLRTMESYKLVRLVRTNKSVRPIVDWDKVDIEVVLAQAA